MGDEEERPPAPRPDPDSLEGLQLTINEKSDETLECTRRMREMCAEAKDAGMKTLIALDDQEVNIPYYYCWEKQEQVQVHDP